MAFGLSPKHVQYLRPENFEPEIFLILAISAAKKKGWHVSFVSEKGFIAYTNFSWSSWSEEISVSITSGSVILKSECTGNQLMDWGKNKKNIQQLLKKLEEVKNTITQEEIEKKLEELREASASKKEDVFNQPVLSSKEKITGFFSIFNPTEGYFVTPLLIICNILIFVAMIYTGTHFLFPDIHDLLDWGANYRPFILEGQWWRLMVSCFLHIGILHLLFNMYALFYIGLLLEPYLGKSRFLAAYLISGIAASVASIWWNGTVVSAGASGAIFGMYGVFLALLSTNLVDKSVRKSLFTSIGVFVVYNLVNGLNPNNGVDNAAHLGGLLTGFVLGFGFVPSLKKFENRLLKFSTIGGMAIVLLISSFSLYKSIPNDLVAYEEGSDMEAYKKEIERFISMESMALEVFALPENTPKDILLSEIKDRGIYYWIENVKLIDNLDKLDLPESIRERNLRLKDYCQFRIKSFNLIYKSIEEDTDKYEKEINYYNEEIEFILTELTGD